MRKGRALCPAFLFPVLEAEGRQLLQRRFQRFRPAFRYCLIIRIGSLEPFARAMRETVGFVNLHVERKSHRKIGFQRGVERDEQQLHRLLETHLLLIGADEDGFTVLVFPNLEERRVCGTLDEIAFRVDIEKKGAAGRP